MDRVGARNSLIILLTLVTLTAATLGVLLLNFVRDPHYDPPQALLTLAVGLVTFFTGTQVNFDAKAKVNSNAPDPEATQNLVSEVAYQVRATAAETASPTTDLLPAAVSATVSSRYLSPEEEAALPVIE